MQLEWKPIALNPTRCWKDSENFRQHWCSR